MAGRESEISEGKEVAVPDGVEPQIPQDKQVYYDDRSGLQAYHIDPQPHAASKVEDARIETPTKSRKKRFVLAGVAAIVLALAVFLPAGFVASRNKNKNSSTDVAESSRSSVTSDSPANAAIDPTQPTSESPGGVLRGSRLSTMDPYTGGDIYLFYQWSDGGLRYISQSPLRVWQGSTHLDVPDAKLGTPLATISTKSDGSTFWWLFYVDKADIVQNIYSESNTTGWRKGNVGDNGFKALNATSIAFTALSGLRYNEDSKRLDGGLSVFVSTSTSTIQEYTFDEQNGEWSQGFTFQQTDGLSGASAWALGSAAWMITASDTGSIILWTKHYYHDAVEDEQQWVRGASSSADLMQNGAMSAQYHAGFQVSSGYIQGSAFSTVEGQGAPRWAEPYDISDQAAINETAVSCRWFGSSPEADRDICFQFFYQTDGSKIDEAVRLWGPDNKTNPGIWTYASIPV